MFEGLVAGVFERRLQQLRGQVGAGDDDHGGDRLTPSSQPQGQGADRGEQHQERREVAEVDESRGDFVDRPRFTPQVEEAAQIELLNRPERVRGDGQRREQRGADDRGEERRSDLAGHPKTVAGDPQRSLKTPAATARARVRQA